MRRREFVTALLGTTTANALRAAEAGHDYATRQENAETGLVMVIDLAGFYGVVADGRPTMPQHW
jgi:hypothetical protein